jgi:hypothetical protein
LEDELRRLREENKRQCWTQEEKIWRLFSNAAEQTFNRKFWLMLKSWVSATWCRIWQFQALTWKRYLQMHLLVEQFVSFRVMIGVFWKRKSIGTNCAS